MLRGLEISPGSWVRWNHLCLWANHPNALFGAFLVPEPLCAGGNVGFGCPSGAARVEIEAL
jgi:hypothetical protein